MGWGHGQAGYAVCIDFKDFVPGKSGGHTGGLGTRGYISYAALFLENKNINDD